MYSLNSILTECIKEWKLDLKIHFSLLEIVQGAMKKMKRKFPLQMDASEADISRATRQSLCFTEYRDVTAAS